MANYGHRITDVDVYYPNKALAQIMVGPGMKLVLETLGQEVVLRYRSKVAKKTGKLMLSAEASTPMGGHKGDRLVAKVTVGGTTAVAEKPWRGAPFYYGVLHEHGSPTKRAQFPAAKDLAEVMQTMR